MAGFARLGHVSKEPHPKDFSFHGTAGWVGRRGAGGDLLLRSLEPAAMRIDLKARLWGPAPEVHLAYLGGPVSPEVSLAARRVLAYETVPHQDPAPGPSGTLEATVTDERGRPLAAKLSLRGLDGTRDPDFGNDGDETGAGRFVWSGSGKFMRTLPPGKYRVLATAGIERDAHSWDVQIETGKTVSVTGKLPRVITTPGWIAGDLHLHQVPSVDSGIGYIPRVIAIAAEGVEFAVATDHYTVADLQPTVDRLRRQGVLASRLQTMMGTEVSTVGNLFGHFNVFPLKHDDFVDYENTTPKRLFAEIRRVAPQGLLQVNHPRWSTVGYWHRYRLDPKQRRVPARLRNEYDPNFDTIEVLNGYVIESEPKMRQVLFDWMHLLGQGHRYVATGGSDSHKLFFVDPGLPRNLIHYGNAESDDDDVKADPQAVVEAIRAGRLTVTTGPVLDVDIDGVGPGGTVRRRRGTLPLHIVVRAAPWIDVSQVEVLLGQHGHRIRWLPVAKSSSVVRLDETVDIRVPGKSFVVVFAKGQRPLPNVFVPSVKPLAFTNPIWIE